MKALLNIFLGCLLLPAAASAALSFDNDKITHQATIDESEYVAVFAFKNIGEEAVEILDVSSSCGCTTAMPSQRVFEPGEAGEITATFQYGSREGKHVKSIEVETNQAKNPNILLTLEVNIPIVLVATPGVITWNTSDGKSVEAKTSILQSHMEDEVEILEIVSTNDLFQHELKVLEKGKKFSLTISPPDVADIDGIVRGTFVVKTNVPNPLKSTMKIYAIIR